CQSRSVTSRHTRSAHSFPTRRSSDLFNRLSEPEVAELLRRQQQAPQSTKSQAASLESEPTQEITRASALASAHSMPQRSRPEDSDRKSTRLNSSHGSSSYAVFCL